MKMNDKDNNRKIGAPVPPSFGGEKPTPPAFDGGAKPTPPPFAGGPKSAPAPPPVPASAKVEAQPVVEEAEEMTTSSKKKRTKSVTDKPKKKKKGCMAKGCMWSFIVFLFLGVIGVVFGEDESNKPTAPESSTAKVEQTTAAADDDEASTAITSRKPFKGSVLALSPFEAICQRLRLHLARYHGSPVGRLACQVFSHHFQPNHHSHRARP